jgi:hypothetical protein
MPLRLSRSSEAHPEVIMFLWRSLDPRTLTSVLGWVADRQPCNAEPARPAAAVSRAVPADGGADPAGVSRRDDPGMR